MNEQHMSESKGKVFLLDKITFFILFFISILTPLFFLPVSFISNQFGTSLLFGFGVILATLVYISRVLVSGYINIENSNKNLWGLFFIVPIIYLLAGIANGFSRMSFFGYTFDISTVGFILLAFIYLYLISVLFNQKNKIFYAFLGFGVSFLIVSLFLFIRMIFGTDVLSFGIFPNLTSTVLGSWNNLGTFFAISTIISMVSLELLRSSKLVKIILNLAFIVSLFFVALVNFGTIWLSVGFISLVFLVYHFFNSGDVKFIKKIAIYPLIVLVLSIVFVIWGSNLGSFLANTFNISSIDVRPSLSVTLDIAKNTIINRPIFGSGPNTFTVQWLSYRPIDIISTIYWNADFNYGIGLLPTFAVTTGLAGVISWIVFFAFYLKFGIKSLFAKFEDFVLKFLVVSSFFTSLYLWIMSFFYVPSGPIFILTLFFSGLFFASLYVSGNLSFDKKVFINNPKSGFVSSLSLVSIFVIVLFIGYGLFKNSSSLWYFQQANYAINTEGNVDKAEENMVKAIGQVPYDVYLRSLSEIQNIKLRAIVSQNPEEVGEEVIASQVENVLPAVISSALAARNANPSNYLNWVSLGQAYASASALGVTGGYESAQAAYNEAFIRNPNNPAIFLQLARLEVDRNNLEGARNWTLQAIQLKQNYLEAYYFLSQVEVAANNLPGAIDSVTAASIINPTDPNIFFQLGLLKYNSADFAGAIDALVKSIELAPDYANAKYFLGLSYARLNQLDMAVTQFEDIQKTNPDNEEIISIINNLREGKSIFQNIPNPQNRQTLPIEDR